MWYNPKLTRASTIRAKLLPRRCIKDYPIENNLELYLRFNEGNGGTVFDYSKYRRHGVIYNASWGKNDFDRGLWFNGVNSYVQTPPVALTGTVISIMAWVNCQKQTYNQTIVSKGGQSTNTGYIYIYRWANSNDIIYQYSTGTTWTSKYASDYFSRYDNQYVLVVTTCDYQNQILKFYRNGQIHTTWNITDPMLFPSSNTYARVGAYYWGASYFKDVIDDVRIYTRILSDQEIRMIYENEKDNYR